MEQIIYIASDHAGFEFKEKIREALKAHYTVVDCGPKEYKLGDDYPDFAQVLCKEVIRHPESKGILLCDTGIGMCMAANRFRGIRAALVTSSFLAERSRLHEDANVLCLGVEELRCDETLELIHTWLATPFSNGDRHKRRIGMLDMIS